MKKMIVLALTLLVGVSSLSGCGTQNKEQSTGTDAAAEAGRDEESSLDTVQHKKDEVIVAVNSEPSAGWNPVTGYGQRYDPILQSTLTKAYGGKITNDRATAYKLSEDGFTWIFTIRDDACYSNGEKELASDVAFTYEQVKENGTSLDLSNIESVSAPDDTTVVFKLHNPDYTFLYITYKVGIVPQVHYDDNYGENPIGSGPFKLVSWEKGQQAVWEYNKYYYGKEPEIKRIVFLFMDDDAAFMAAQRGDVDLVYTNQNLAASSIEGYRMENIESIDNYGIIFPTVKDEGKKASDGQSIGNNVTGDVAIRRALSVGLDRKKLIADVFNGYGKSTHLNHLWQYNILVNFFILYI